MKYKKGTRMFWKKDCTPAYMKLDDEDFGWWVALDSNYLVEVKEGNKVVGHDLKPESDKPLYDRNGRLNRYGWRWTDEQVWDYYKDLMFFKQPV